MSAISGCNSYQASVTGPITDTLAFRLTGYDNNRSGYIQDVTTGQDLLQPASPGPARPIAVEAGPTISPGG